MNYEHKNEGIDLQESSPNSHFRLRDLVLLETESFCGSLTALLLEASFLVSCETTVAARQGLGKVKVTIK